MLTSMRGKPAVDNVRVSWRGEVHRNFFSRSDSNYLEAAVAAAAEEVQK